MEPPARRVQLVVASDHRSPSDIAEFLGARADKETRAGSVPSGRFKRPARDNSWELCEAGDGSTDISALLARVFDRVGSLRNELRELRLEGCRVIVSVVLYLSPDDPVGGGFVLESEFARFLADVGIPFEVDQYVDVE